ncbi:MAG: cold shock domain-containing protein, partial [Bdellovibrionales bacterium]|nr:cold shock domain-containing protein [Bdellovibrionales bacterium]
MSDTQKGVVKWFNDAKGFGFLEHETGKDVFVHYSVIQSEGFKTLKDGEAVDYELSEGPKGLHAVKVYRSPEAIAASQREQSQKAAAAQAAPSAPEQARSIHSAVQVERIPESEAPYTSNESTVNETIVKTVEDPSPVEKT